MKSWWSFLAPFRKQSVYQSRKEAGSLETAVKKNNTTQQLQFQRSYVSQVDVMKSAVLLHISLYHNADNIQDYSYEQFTGLVLLIFEIFFPNTSCRVVTLQDTAWHLGRPHKKKVEETVEEEILVGTTELPPSSSNELGCQDLPYPEKPLQLQGSQG